MTLLCTTYWSHKDHRHIDFNIFDYSNATYALPSQIHVIHCEPVSVVDSVLIWISLGSLSANIWSWKSASVYTAACNSLYTEYTEKLDGHWFLLLGLFNFICFNLIFKYFNNKIANALPTQWLMAYYCRCLVLQLGSISLKWVRDEFGWG